MLPSLVPAVLGGALLLVSSSSSLVSAQDQQGHVRPPTIIGPARGRPPGAEILAGQLCSQLTALLNSTIVLPRQEEDFQEVARGAWNLYNALSQPACIVFPRTTEHVQQTMRAIYQSGGVRYAVQAGGHSAMRGWNTVDGDGVLISFMYMDAVSYNATRDSITLQPGIRWGEAIEQLEPFGVAPMGGRLPDVGTGLLLGGGLSYLSAAHGFSVDSLREADVVLVNGDKVTATATNQYSDLFRALKGGANRFGIVTRYEVDAIHVGTKDEKKFWGGTIVMNTPTANQTQALLRATANYVDKTTDPGTSLLVVLGVTFSNTTTAPVNVVTFFYNGTGNPQEIYKDFLELPFLDTDIVYLDNWSYVGATTILGNGDDRGFGQLFGASAFGNKDYDQDKLGYTPEANFKRYTNAYSKFQEFIERVSATPPVTPNPGTGFPPPLPSYTWIDPQPRATTRPSPPPPPPAPTTRTVSQGVPGTPRPTPGPPGTGPLPPWPIFPGPIFPGPWPGPPTSSDAGIASALIAFTPVLKSQILAGRARGGNSIDPPLANFHFLQFHVQTLPGPTTDLIRIQEARARFLQSVPASPGLPLYINECDETQPAFVTYGQYPFLRQTYAKYDPTRFNMRFTLGPMGL